MANVVMGVTWNQAFMAELITVGGSFTLMIRDLNDVLHTQVIQQNIDAGQASTTFQGVEVDTGPKPKWYALAYVALINTAIRSGLPHAGSPVTLNHSTVYYTIDPGIYGVSMPLDNWNKIVMS